MRQETWLIIQASYLFIFDSLVTPYIIVYISIYPICLLLTNIYWQISHEFRALDKLYQDVIADITKRMGCGMTVFFDRDLDTEKHWDEVSDDASFP